MFASQNDIITEIIERAICNINFATIRDIYIIAICCFNTSECV